MCKVLLRISLMIFILGCDLEKNESTQTIPGASKWQFKKVDQRQKNLKLDTLLDHVKRGTYGFIDEIFIARNDSILHQSNYRHNYHEISKGIRGKMGCGSDMCKDSSEIHLYNYYHPKYHPYYEERKLHTLQSVTKTIAGAVIGAAIQQGEISGVDEALYPYFSDYDLSEKMKRHLESKTIKDVLTMQLGLAWRELGMTLEMESNVSEMEMTDDWVSYVLSQEIESEKLPRWNYSSGASQLLSQIIASATSETIEEYAKEHLFQRMDITEYYWKSINSKLPDTESGLYLSSEDLAKFGLLHLQDGMWNGKRLLPIDWVAEATAKQVHDIYGDGGKEGYGYQWWITADDPSLAVGLGYGNQILIILPKNNIVGVVYAWNIFEQDVTFIFRDFVETLQDY